MYKSEYKMQKEFEKMILTASYEEIAEKFSYSISPYKNKCQCIYNAAERGDEKIFKLLLNNYKQFRSNSFDVYKFSKILFSNESLEIIKSILEDSRELDFKFSFNIRYNKFNSFVDGFFSYISKENINIEIFEYIINNVNFPYGVGIDRLEKRERILKIIVDNNMLHLINEKFVKMMDYESSLVSYFFKYAKNKNNFKIIEIYLNKIKEAYILKTNLIKAQNECKHDFITNLKNEFITEKDLGISLLEIAILGNNYQLIKKTFKNSSKKVKLEALKSMAYAKNKRKMRDTYNLYLKNNYKEIEENINEILKSALLVSNEYFIDLILENTKKEEFAPEMLSYAVYANGMFEKFINDGRFNKDTEDLQALKKTFLFDDVKRATIISKFEDVKENITAELISELYEDKKLEILKVLLNVINAKELSGYEYFCKDLKDKIDVFDRLKGF